MAEKVIIGGELEPQGMSGIVTNSRYIKDSLKNKTQAAINEELYGAIGNIDAEATERSTHAVSSGGVYSDFEAMGEDIYLLNSVDAGDPVASDNPVAPYDYAAGDVFCAYQGDTPLNHSRFVNARLYYVALQDGNEGDDMSGDLFMRTLSALEAIQKSSLVKLEADAVSVNVEQTLAPTQVQLAQRNIGLQKGVANGVASLDNNGIIPQSQANAISLAPQMLNETQKVQAQNNMMGKSYVPAQFSGLGKKVLAQNIQQVGGVDKNVMTQAFFEDDQGNPLTNTVFVIQYDYTLGEDITVPANCVLEFDGGSISAGSGSNMNTINGQNTKIISNSTIFNNVIISGTWKCPLIYSNWISSVTNNKLQQLINLTNNSIYNKITVTDDIEVVLHSEVSDIAGIAVDIENKNDIEIIINSTITLAPNGYPDYKMFFIQNCNNIYIHGSGNIIGDKDNHDYTTHQNDGYKTHEWGRGICVRQSNSVIIDGLTIEKLTGDGLTLGSITNQEPSKNIKVNNISIHDCRRQGITIAKINGIIISNFHIYNISGTNPQSGIDIEPDNGGSAENITIINGVINSSYCAISMWTSLSVGYPYKNIVFENIKIYNCGNTDINSTSSILGLYHATNIKLSKISIENCTNSFDLITFDSCLDCSIDGLWTEDISATVLLSLISTNNMELNNILFDSPEIPFIYTPNEIYNLKILNSKLTYSNIHKTTGTLNNVLFDNCRLEGQMFTNLEKCKFVNCTITNDEAISTYANSTWKNFKDCIFDNVDFLQTISIEGKNITITNSRFIGVKLGFFYGPQFYSNNIKIVNNVFKGYSSVGDIISLEKTSEVVLSGNKIDLSGSTTNMPRVVFISTDSTRISFIRNIINTNSNYAYFVYSSDNNISVELTDNVFDGTFREELTNTSLTSVGSFSKKPASDISVGHQYFCTSGASIDGGTTEKQNIQIFYTGNEWVDANGNVVVAKL